VHRVIERVGEGNPVGGGLRGARGCVRARAEGTVAEQTRSIENHPRYFQIVDRLDEPPVGRFDEIAEISGSRSPAVASSFSSTSARSFPGGTVSARVRPSASVMSRSRSARSAESYRPN
jgi:hypothetical protein